MKRFARILAICLCLAAISVVAASVVGCGNSTLIKTLNRMNDLVDGCRVTGEVKIGGVNVYDKSVDLAMLRKNVGMVFQRPNPLAMSVYDNIAYGPRTLGIRLRADLDAIVENTLKKAAMWDEVKDRLNKSALGLSGGQQQRLCIARALAVVKKICDKSGWKVELASEPDKGSAFTVTF